MQGLINDLLRELIAFVIRALGFILQHRQRIQVVGFTQSQQRLKRRYGITSQTPVLLYGSEIERLIDGVARKLGRKAKFALTSGSTGRPKRLLYSKQRLNALKRTYIYFFSRACFALRIKRSSLYLFSAFTQDDSLTTMLLDDHRLPSYLTTLQAPYRVQCDEAITKLVEDYGSAAVRLWLLTISNPGVLYSTNPSTIVSFLDEVNTHWSRSRQLVKDWYDQKKSFNRRLHKIARRIDSRGRAQRIARIAQSNSALPLEVWAPGVHAYICWTGGYVKPFLDRLTDYLPAAQYQLIPMYSMSTETVETLTCFQEGKTSFLPLARGVAYEFLEEGRADDPVNLLRPDQLQIGRNYSMVVSDAFGLRRYQTDDLFRCEDTTMGLPNLTFQRRRSLEYSFTGEKLTAEQLAIVFQELTEQHPALFRNVFLTCIPWQSEKEVPHYSILAVGDTVVADLSRQCDERLCELNIEYKSKRLSGRLGEVRFISVATEEFIQHFVRGTSTAWEMQFKFLPLYREVWNSQIPSPSANV